MTRFLLATDSVHTTAAACDHLEGRVGVEDHVTVLAVTGPGADARDAGDALNVARVRLPPGATIDTETREGDPAEVVLSLAAERDADEIVIGPRSGAPDAEATLGGTARAVLVGATVPVVVVPLVALE